MSPNRHKIDAGFSESAGIKAGVKSLFDLSSEDSFFPVDTVSVRPRPYLFPNATCP